jgi:hypothetical protein
LKTVVLAEMKQRGEILRASIRQGAVKDGVRLDKVKIGNKVVLQESDVTQAMEWRWTLNPDFKHPEAAEQEPDPTRMFESRRRAIVGTMAREMRRREVKEKRSDRK